MDVDALRERWNRAMERDRPAEAIGALVALEQALPKDAMWSQRLGEAYRRTGQRAEAVEAFARACERFGAQGFVPRAIAMAKLVASFDAARGAALEARLAPPEPSTALRAPRPAPLAPVPDAAADEVRFVDAPEASVSVLLVDLYRHDSIDVVIDPASLMPGRDPSATLVEESVRVELGASDILDAGGLADESARLAPGASGVLGADGRVDDEDDEPTRNVPPRAAPDAFEAMASFRLFGGVSREALVALAGAAELVEVVAGAPVIVRAERASALYAIVSGNAKVRLGSGETVELGEGDVFGEASILMDGERQADVDADGPLVVLRIAKEALTTVVASHPEVEDALFALLARRLVTNLIATSPLFAAFEPQVRFELAQMFEVRRAEPGTVLAERGRRSDGLYLHLAGHLVSEEEGRDPTRLASGAAFGHGSLVGRPAARATVRALGEAVVLRMPAASFTVLAMQYPPALAHLAESSEP